MVVDEPAGKKTDHQIMSLCARSRHSAFVTLSAMIAAQAHLCDIQTRKRSSGVISCDFVRLGWFAKKRFRKCATVSMGFPEQNS
jgi:hypothetical protein